MTLKGYLVFKIKAYFFKRRWRLRNKHNRTEALISHPIDLFPMDIVSIGRKTYGLLHILDFDPHNKSDRIQIGNFVSIAPGVKFIFCGNHQTKTITTFPLKSILFEKQFADDARNKGSIIVEDEVWIGADATIMAGVRIGKGAIVSTGSIVIQDVPPYTIVQGNPAMIIKKRFADEVIKVIENIFLNDFSDDYLKRNIDDFYVAIETQEGFEKIRKFNDYLSGLKNNIADRRKLSP